MVTVTRVLRRTSTVGFLEAGGSSGESSRSPSIVDSHAPRRPSLASLSLRLTSRSKRFKLSKAAETTSPAAEQLGEAFFSLPEEITAQILCYLPQADIFSLRLTSRTLYSLISSHASPITRSVLMHLAYDQTSDNEDGTSDERAQHAYHYIQTIYPRPQPCTSMDYLLQMIRRQTEIQKMLAVMSSYIQMRVYMEPNSPRFECFGPYRHRLVRRFYLSAWTIYHFLEKFREMLVLEHPFHTQEEEELPAEPCQSCAEFVEKLVRGYPGTEIIRAYLFYDIARQHLRALSRAPTYAGSMKRRLRGWNRAPTESDLMQLVVWGGISELSKLSLLKGSYNSRMEAIGTFVDKTQGVSGQQRAGSSKSSSSSHGTSALGTSSGCASFDRLTKPLRPPFPLITPAAVSAVPDLDGFIIDSESWTSRLFELIRPEDQIVSGFGLVQNILTGKGEPRYDIEGVAGEGAGPPELDYLAPVRGFF